MNPNPPNETTTANIRIVIVDDHDMVRSGLATFLSEFDDFELVGEARDGEEGVRLCTEVEPDIVLMDLVMPGKLNGVEATKAILGQTTRTRVIALTTFDQDDLVNGAMQAGAISYLLKRTTIQELGQAIRDAYKGRATIAQEALQVLIRAHEQPQQPNVHLTSREQEVLKCMVRGSTNRQISTELDVSVSTVKQHVSSILAKLGASSRTEAVAIAMQYQLVE